MKTIINIEDFKIELTKSFSNYTFNSVFRGQGWYYVFVRYQGIQLGRITLRNIPNHPFYAKEIFYLKHYKSRMNNYSYEPEDAFFYQFEHWCNTGSIILINHLVEIAKKNAEAKYIERLKWRQDHPIERHRSKLQKSWMGEFRKLVNAEIIKQ
jgi:hypothetical protein